MGLPVPVVAQDPGPDWATNVNACLSIVDQHNHSPGSGAPLAISSLAVTQDFSMNGYNLVNVQGIQFQNLGFTPANLGFIYEKGGDLFYNDGSGNVIQITRLGSVNAGGGSISGLPSGTAGVAYSAGSYYFYQATNTPAPLVGGSIKINGNTLGANGVTLNASAGMGADYSLQLPATAPAQGYSLVTVDGLQDLGWLEHFPITGIAGTTASATYGGGVFQLLSAPAVRAILDVGVFNATNIYSSSDVNATASVNSAAVSTGNVSCSSVSSTGNVDGTNLRASVGLEGPAVVVGIGPNVITILPGTPSSSYPFVLPSTTPTTYDAWLTMSPSGQTNPLYRVVLFTGSLGALAQTTLIPNYSTYSILVGCIGMSQFGGVNYNPIGALVTGYNGIFLKQDIGTGQIDLFNADSSHTNGYTVMLVLV
jgi:hypothetical protein